MLLVSGESTALLDVESCAAGEAAYIARACWASNFPRAMRWNWRTTTRKPPDCFVFPLWAISR